MLQQMFKFANELRLEDLIQFNSILKSEYAQLLDSLIKFKRAVEAQNSKQNIENMVREENIQTEETKIELKFIDIPEQSDAIFKKIGKNSIRNKNDMEIIKEMRHQLINSKAMSEKENEKEKEKRKDLEQKEENPKLQKENEDAIDVPEDEIKREEKQEEKEEENRIDFTEFNLNFGRSIPLTIEPPKKDWQIAIPDNIRPKQNIAILALLKDAEFKITSNCANCELKKCDSCSKGIYAKLGISTLGDQEYEVTMFSNQISVIMGLKNSEMIQLFNNSPGSLDKKFRNLYFANPSALYLQFDIYKGKTGAKVLQIYPITFEKMHELMCNPESENEINEEKNTETY